MARLRYVKTAEQVKQAAESNPEFLSSTVRSVRCVYETNAAIGAAILPRPLEPTGRPEVALTVSHVEMHITPDFTMEIGSAIFGVPARYDGVEGTYLLTMPMTTEAAVVGGRETYGEPKKIASIDFQRDGNHVVARVTRMGIPYIEVRGEVGEETGPRKFREHAWCFKALPSCERGRGFDADPLLVRLDWNHDQTKTAKMQGDIILRESPFDPVADLPVRRILKMEYEEGNTASNGTVLRSVPGEWLLPFLHQRYDDPSAQGIEIAD